MIWRQHDWLWQPWTLWTAPLFHLSFAHAVANFAALGALCAMALVASRHKTHPKTAKAFLLRRFAVGLFCAWPLSTLSLIFSPEVHAYAGLSGVVHAATGLLACILLRLHRFVGLCLLMGLATKLWLEQAWLAPVVWSDHWGFEVANIAHLYGAGVGVVIGLPMALFKRPPESA